MDERLFYKIIDELGSINYAGRISPHFYGEPLLDKRIFNFISYIRKKCPYSYIRFSSNGDLLTEDIFKKLISSGLDMIFVTNYDDQPKPELIGLTKKYPKNISYRDFKDVSVVNRAGVLIANKKNKNIEKACLRPSNQLVVNWKGNVILCCNDYYEKYIFGNLNKQSVLDVWNSDKFNKYRKLLLEESNRKKIDICKNCDL
jgi:2-deoxy-scyllo-inosamine dehydrogenase (SAM-dependent)/8-amino-3,8-dideoxy-alpha-D-manno-octulosonate transaminase